MNMRKELLPILSPCTENWDAMDGDERHRACQKCDQEVVNLSELTDREVARLFQRPSAKVPCVRYAFDDEGNLELRPRAVLPLIPAALLTRGREIVLGASLAAAALAGCNPAGPVGDAVLARAAIGKAAEKLAENGTCTVSMEPMLPLEVRLHAAPCVAAPTTAAELPMRLAAAELPPSKPPTPPPPPATVPAPATDPSAGSPTEPCHKPVKKPPKYQHKLMGKPIFRPEKNVY